MRIGVLTTSYPRGPADPSGGFVRGFARWLAAQGHELEVLAAATADDLAAEAPGDPGITVRWIRYAPRRLQRLFSRTGAGAPEALEAAASAWPLAAAYGLALAAATLRRAPRWDAVVSHWLLPSGVLAAALAPGRPHLAIAHSGDVHLAVRLGLAPLVARALAGADLVFASAELRARFLAAAGRAARRVAHSRAQPMGVEAGALPDPAERAAARARLRPRPGRLLVGFLGRLVPIKAPGLLIEAAGGAPVSLRIAGAGPLAGALAEAARRLPDPDVELLGPLPADGPARRDFLAGLDLLAVPSTELPSGRTEGTPVVILEAIAHGIPVIGARTGGIAEAIGDCGLTIPVADVAALSAALRTLQETPAELARFRAAAEARAASLRWADVGPRLAAKLLQSRSTMDIFRTAS